MAHPTDERVKNHHILRKVWEEMYAAIEEAKQYEVDIADCTIRVAGFYIYAETNESDKVYVEVLEDGKEDSFRDFPALQHAIEETLPSWDDVEVEEEEEEYEDYPDMLDAYNVWRLDELN